MEAEALATLDYVHHLAFPKLSDSEVESLAGLATICSFKDGELIFQAGQRGLPFYVVESGEIARHSSLNTTTISRDSTRFLPGRGLRLSPSENL